VFRIAVGVGIGIGIEADDMSFGPERLDVYRGVATTRSEYAAVRIDPDADSDSDPERQGILTDSTGHAEGRP
jgi:hypothetical protein